MCCSVQRFQHPADLHCSRATDFAGWAPVTIISNQGLCGLFQVLWEGYVEGMKRAVFDAEVDVYVASGLDPSSTGGSSH